MYLIWYGVARFFIEGTRTDSLMVGPLRVSQVVAAVCVLAGVVLLVMFRHRNELSGCGSKYVMESVGLTKTEAEPEGPRSTIFGDLPPFEDDSEEPPVEDAASQEDEDKEDSEKES